MAITSKRTVNRPKIFKTPPRPNTPICQSGIVSGLAAMSKAFETMEIDVRATGLTGKIEWKNGIPRIIIEDAT